MRGGQVTALVAAIAVAALLSTAEQWEPMSLLIALAVGVVFSDLVSVQLNHIWVSASAVALAGAMVLLGPAPAVAIGVVSQLLDSAIRPRGWGNMLANVSTFAGFALVGAVVFDLLDTEELARSANGLTVPVVLGVYMLSNALNFWLIAVDSAIADGQPIRMSFRDVYVPTLRVDLAMGLLTASAVLGYFVLGPAAIGLLAVISLTFQYLMKTVWESSQRGYALERRTKELSALQVGLLTTVLQTLSLRDAMTARHSAAVARYSREIAKAMELSEVEQDLVHTAGLLHDIGKFIFPDSILFAGRGLTDAEFAIVRRHPEQGARLVRRIEGYGPVAEIIHAHHERLDGTGYPRRLPAERIPAASRIIAVADTYDVMTARDSYKEPVTSEVAIAELRRVSGTQLDGRIVEIFIDMIEQRGVNFRHHDAADFEAELSFDRRVLDYAAPREVAT